MTAQKVAAIVLLATALTLAAFGIARGVMSAGPAHGTRMIVTIDPPVDRDVLELAEHSVHARLDDKDARPRIIASGGRIVIEVAEDDPANVNLIAALLERSAKLELHASTGPATFDPAPLLDGRSIRRAGVFEGGVAIDVREASALAPLASLRPGTPLAFVLDGRAAFVGAPDRIVGTELHVPTPGTNEDQAIAHANELIAMIEAGAAHPMHVVQRDPFTRATGFVPRALPFLIAAGVVALIAAAFALRRRKR